MVDLFKINFNFFCLNCIFYLCRYDREMNYKFKLKNIFIENLDVDDWIFFNWMNKIFKGWIYILGFVCFIREGW